MARDRQRSRQRRRRPQSGDEVAARPAGRPQDGGSADPTHSGDELDAARDQGIEDVLDERGPEGTTPAPDPLRHSSPYVDQAKLSEAGAFIDPPDAASAGSDADADAGVESAEEPEEAHAGATPQATRGNRATTFLRHSAQELRRVRWPDRRQTGQGTAVTLGFVVLAGGFLGLMDAIWRPIVEAII